MFLYGLSSCTSLYEWLSIFLWVFVMYIFVRMTIHIMLACVFVIHISIRMTIHILMGFVMHIFLRMTIHFLVYGFSSCTFLYEWLSIYWVSSCTFLYEWLPFLFESVFVMHISVRMTTISFWMSFRHAYFCTNYYQVFMKSFPSCTFLYEWLPFHFEGVFVMHI